MKTLFFALFVALAFPASAASVAMLPPAGTAFGSSGFTTASSFTGQFSAAAFNSAFTTQVGGKAVTIPAAMRMAANAGQFAVTAVRATPSIAGPAVLAWLATAGISYVAGQWMKSMETAYTGYWSSGGYSYNGKTCDSTTRCSAEEAANIFVKGYGFRDEVAEFAGSAFTCGSTMCLTVKHKATYPGAPSYVLGSITRLGTVTPTVPATDADWAAVPATLPDQAATELAPKIPLPLQNPAFDPKYVDVPLNDPYIDPVTGKRYQDYARVTPQSDAKTADVQSTKQEVDEAGNPKKQEDGQTPKPPEDQNDFCKKNPDAIACLEKGETDDETLKNENRGGAISPVSIGGGGSCPASKSIPLPGGGSTTFSYQPICDGATMIKPVVLAIAWLIAGYILLGAVRNE